MHSLKIDKHIFQKNDPISFAVRNDWPELVQILNKGLSSISDDKRAQIKQKWLAVPIIIGLSKKEMVRIVLQIIAFMGILLLSFIYWNRKLQKEINVRIQTENERRKAEEAAKKLQYYLKKAQEIGSIGTWELDIKNNNLTWTDETYRVFGISTDTELTYETFLNCVHPDDREYVEKEWNAALNGKPYDIDHRLVTDDGSIKWAREKAEFEFNKEGVCFKATGVTQDITKRKKAEEELRMNMQELTEARNLMQNIMEDLDAAKNSAEDANRAKSDFLANMSHELRTPLNAILGFSDVLHKGIVGPVTQDQQSYLKDIHESGAFLLDLINDILDLSKVEAGIMKLDLKQINLKDLVEKSFVMFKEKAMRHRIKISSEIDNGAVNIFADERKIKQVMFNLMSNAMKFTSDGGTISITANVPKDKKDFIEISVEDSGIGISDEDQQRLFQPFLQLDSTLTKEHQGTGLGLNLCWNIVKLHGGKIWIESEIGKGSRFIFIIPCKAELNR
jgi:PAS domain S-box-containing protein